MISYIKGELAEILDDAVVLECNNIGYNVKVPQSVINNIMPGREIKLYTYFYVREDAMNLYGFLTRDDLNVFKLLISVNGIGPKAGLQVLSVMTADDLRIAVLSDDKKSISKCPGIGPKTASKMILELKDKLKLSDVIESRFADDNNIENINAQDGSSVRNEAIEALVALGYSNSDALKAVRSVDITEDMDSSDILKAALKKFAYI